jgi:hypothetical protein
MEEGTRPIESGDYRDGGEAVKETPFISESATVSEVALAETVLGIPTGNIVTLRTAPHANLWMELIDGSQWRVDRHGGWDLLRKPPK